MMLEDVTEIQVCGPFGCNLYCHRYEMRHFRELIHAHIYCIAEMAMYRIGPDLGWFSIRSELFKRDSGPINSELGANPVRSGSELHQQNSNSGPVTHIEKRIRSGH